VGCARSWRGCCCIAAFDLAHQSNGGIPRPEPQGAPVGQVRASVQRVLGAMNVAAIVQNTDQDIVASNPLGRALYSPRYDIDGQPNVARFVFLDSRAQRYYVD
jgi:hypothetical protein